MATPPITARRSCAGAELAQQGAVRRLMRKLLKNGRAPRVLITDKLKSYAAANRDLRINVEHRQHKRLNNRAKTRTSQRAYARR